jgi:ELWxxDGT repeat protein
MVMRHRSWFPPVIWLTALILLGAVPTASASEPVLVKDLNPSTAPDTWAPSQPAGVGNTLLFRARNSPALGQELWKSDGTDEGTVVLKDINPVIDAGTGGGSFPGGFVGLGGTLYFTAFEPDHGTELWMTDGTADGTVLVKDINPGPAGSVPVGLVNLGGTLYFTATDPDNGTELWMSDGTPDGTVLIKDIVPGPSSGYPSPVPLAKVAGILYFAATDRDRGEELWRSDGTADGTMPVRVINPTPDATPGIAAMTVLNGMLYFIDDVGNLWKSDGTPENTLPFNVEIPGGCCFNAYGHLPLINFKGALYFGAGDTARGSELWKSDGTEEGTAPLKDIVPGTGSCNPYGLNVVGGTLYFFCASPDSQLWKSDGTADGTVLVDHINAGTADPGPSSSAGAEDMLYFQAFDSVHGKELWGSDGTAEGTYVLKDINPGTGNSNPKNLTDVNGTLYFTAFDPVHRFELWRYSPVAVAETAGSTLTYRASTGTSNDITISLASGAYTIRDPVETISAGTGCTSVGPHEVTCSATGVTSVHVDAGDGNDVLRQVAPTPSVVNGGPGDDSLFGGAAADTLNGGDGDDQLVGGGGKDALNGDAGTDLANYQARHKRVTVTLDGLANDGAGAGHPGEADNVRTENVTGGSAADRLTGDSAANVLKGGPGADVLIGLDGDDSLLANDGVADTILDCDGGTSPGTADSAALDLLDPDPLGCETVTRG